MGKAKLYLISYDGNTKVENVYVEIDVTQAGEWNSFTFPLSDFAEVDLSHVNQFKFDNAGYTDKLDTFYIDNLYFAASTDNSWRIRRW